MNDPGVPTLSDPAVALIAAAPPIAARFQSIDPRDLVATQLSAFRDAVEHYMGDTYWFCGRPFRDSTSALNLHGLVLRDAGENVILNGHQRATAALLQGRPFLARTFTWADLKTGHTVPAAGAADARRWITPSLIVGTGQVVPESEVECHTAADAVDLVRAREVAWLATDSQSEVREVLRGLNVEPAWADHLVRFAFALTTPSPPAPPPL